MKINKKSALVVLILGFNTLIFAQNSSNEQISLPDVTTVVTGDKPGLIIPSPEMDKTVKLPKKSSNLAPEVPQIKKEKPLPLPPEQEKQASFQIEGKIGGGYPANVLGNILIKNNTQTNPFSILFNHSSISGMGGQPQTRGYSATDTGLVFSKKFSFTKSVLNIYGLYDSTSNGFQSQVEKLSSVNQNNAKGNIDYELCFRDIHKISFEMDTSFYSRYNDITSFELSLPQWQESSSLLSFTPAAAYSISFLDNKINLTASAKYNLDMDVKGNLVDESTIYTSGKTLNRGEFQIGSTYDNSKVSLSGNVGVVFGDHQNQNSVIFPFSLKAVSLFSLANGKQIRVGAEGGLKSQKTSIIEEENKYKYSAFSFIPEENSFWYARSEAKFPLGANINLGSSLDFARTAFGNGFWETDYTAQSYSNGLFIYKNTEKTLLSTDFSVDFVYGALKIMALAKINFLDLKPLESRYNYNVKFLWQPETRLSGCVSVRGAFDSSDIIPVIDFEGSLKLSEQVNAPVQIAIQVQDFIKLISGTTRIYAGDYISEGGKITMLVKFKY